MASKNITLLQSTLKNVLDPQPFEISLLLEFLTKIGPFHLSQQQRLEKFKSEWTESLNKMLILTFGGTWTPQCSSPTEIKKQRPWQEFAQRYGRNFMEPDIDGRHSPAYQPINFKCLLRLSVWQDLYKSLGEKIVAYIFDKCAIIFEADEGLHILVAYSQGTTHKKIKKYQGVSLKLLPKNRVSTRRMPQVQYQFQNPYKLLENVKDVTYPKVTEHNEAEVVENPPENVDLPKNSKRKRKPNTDPAEDSKPAIKRQKTCSTCGEREVKDPLITIPGPRWMKPNSKALAAIVEHREKLRSRYGNSSSTSSGASVPGNLTELNYIAIFKDENFEPKYKEIVIKEKLDVSSKISRLPKKWEGLRLPENVTGKSEPTTVIVYKISETLALKLGLRLKPKARCRKNKKKGTTGSEVISDFCESNTIPNIPTICRGNVSDYRQTNILQTTNKTSDQMSSSSSCRLDFSSPKSFSQSVKLPISACLYNKSTRPKWPSNHSSSEAVLLCKQGDKMESIWTLISSILDKPICSKDAYQHLINIFNSNWIRIAEDSWNVTIYSVIEAHLKFHDLHKLMKNCVKHWKTKYGEKHQRRIMKAKDRRLSKEKSLKEVDNEKKEASFKDGKSDSPLPEVIDLTQTTSSTNFSSRSEYGISPEHAVSNVQQVLSAMHIQVKQTKGQSKIGGDEKNLNKSYDRKSVGNNTTRSKSLYEPKAKITRKSSGEVYAKQNAFRSLKHDVPPNCVMMALKHIFHIMKLDKLLGTQRNVRGFFKFVRKALILGGTRSDLHLSQAMALVRPEETHFAQLCGGDVIAMETFVAKLIVWLFNDYVLELLKMSFYITECGFARMQLKFYLQESWTSASHKMKSCLCQTGSLIKKPDSDKTRTTAVLRFLPKSNHNLRSIVNMKKSAGLTLDDIKRFKLLLHFIDAQINKSRTYLATGLLSDWRNFLTEWKSMGSPKLYYHRFDIRDAYPSVSVSRLKEIIFETVGNAGKTMVQKKFILIKYNGRVMKRESVFSEDSQRTDWRSGIHVRSCIVMDLENDTVLDVEKILEKCISHVESGSVVKVGKMTYEFNYGLPQGWGPSPILCNIYYGYIHSRLYRPDNEHKGRLFLRVVDDHLLISPEPTEVAKLIESMPESCKKYGIKLNQEKSENNIFAQSNVAVLSTYCEKITFCGWNLCITCGHVSRDYSKYKEQDYCSTITFKIPDEIYCPEEFIRVRGTLITPIRLKPIVLDLQINCRLRIIQTIFEASILLGFRFYALCRVVYPSLNALKEKERAKTLNYCISLCCSRLARSVKLNPLESGSHKVQISCEGRCCGCLVPLMSTANGFPSQPAPTVEVFSEAFHTKCLTYLSLKYVSLLGFRLKLLRHSETFREQIIPRINSEISRVGEKLGQEHCACIVKVIGERIPDELDQILI